MRRKGRLDARGYIASENRDYTALARAAAAELLARGEPVTQAAIAAAGRMSPHNAGRALRYLRSVGELPGPRPGPDCRVIDRNQGSG